MKNYNDKVSHEQRLRPQESGLIGEETLKKRISNNEQEMSNIEVRYSVDFIKMTEQSETTLRHSAVRYSTFCGSIFDILRFAIKVVSHKLLAPPDWGI